MDSGAELAIDRPKRWAEPFADDLSDDNVNDILGAWPFNEIDVSMFSRALPLEGLVRNDMRLVEYQPGEVIVRQGDYGNTAFVILSGEVDVILPPGLPPRVLGRGRSKKESFIGAFSKRWRNAKYSEVRSYKKQKSRNVSFFGAFTDRQKLDIDALKKRDKTLEVERLSPREMFGVMATMGRTERNTTVCAHSETRVVEIRWQALRDIRQRAANFREYLESYYRKRSLAILLRKLPFFAHLDEQQMVELSDSVSFESYGEYEWTSKFKSTDADEQPAKRLQSEPMIAREGDYSDGLLIVSNGSARIAQSMNHGQRTVSFVGAGGLFGLQELAHQWKTNEPISLVASLRSLGYTDVIRVPSVIIERLVFDKISAVYFEKLANDSSQNNYKMASDGNLNDIGTIYSSTLDQVATVDAEYSGLKEFFLEQRFVNGSQAMVIDLDRCTRCDECVTACAQGHNNNPRFVRHGKTHGKYMIANACMHCHDPVCMIGCPTGAIHRTPEGVVKINDSTCIGCSSCANACPYDNIRMVEIRNRQGEALVDKENNKPVVKATKCDLCVDQPGKPACQRACPHDALVRLDLGDELALSAWMNR